ncbi:hypothetical protein LEMLEM_LOCUS25755 [Lemmus lemmus]
MHPQLTSSGLHSNNQNHEGPGPASVSSKRPRWLSQTRRRKHFKAGCRTR